MILVLLVLKVLILSLPILLLLVLVRKVLLLRTCLVQGNTGNTSGKWKKEFRNFKYLRYGKVAAKYLEKRDVRASK